MNNQEGDLLRHPSILQQIWKYKLHYVIVIPALFFILTFKVWPFLYGFILSMKNYQPMHGISDSEWVGFQNYISLLKNLDYRNVLSNTLAIKISYIVISGITAFVIALALSGVRSNRLRQIFSTLFLIPFFIPSVVFASLAMLAVSPSKSPFVLGELFVLADPELFSPFIVFIEIVKTSGIPVLIALAAIAYKHGAVSQQTGGLSLRQSNYASMNIIPALRAVCAYMLLQTSTLLSSDLELITSLLNPLVYQTGDIVDTYNFRMGFHQMNYSAAAASDMIRFCIQFVFTIAAYFAVKSLFSRDLFSRSSPESKLHTPAKTSSIIGIVVAAFFAIIVLIPVYLLFIYPLTIANPEPIAWLDTQVIWNTILQIFISFVSVIIFLLMTVTLAYPLTVENLPGRGLYKLFLLFALVLGVNGIGEYMLFRNMEMINTVFPQLVFGFFNLVSVFVLKSIFNSKYSNLKAEAERGGRGELHTMFTLFIPKVWKPLLALGVLQFVAIWNSYFISLLYINNPEQFSALMRFMQISASAEGGSPSHLQMGALIALPPLLLFLIFRKWLTAEVLISQIRKL
ncbi:ABC-type polysaccharide transport system permease subunit [Paenibacillus castaneae]|uniref:hypothetical protein n=1 Tax=Paenibacillus castaneae TaxID=474957 RepID=UPI000C9AD70B|nr:hypothetical protein [Paenibacillus castaneae]NIK75438.1 ABC-type polysaccharide transport system permease subunit [Paenibacillus castaneae]